MLNKSVTFRMLGGSGGGSESKGRREGRGVKGHFMVSTDQKLEERVGVRLNVRPRGSTPSGSGCLV